MAECDDSSLVSSETETGEVFEEIAETLESSAALMSVLKSHGEKVRYPRGVFTNEKNGYLWIALAIGAIIALISGYKYYSGRKRADIKYTTMETIDNVKQFVDKVVNDVRNGPDYRQIDAEHEDTEPLMG